MASGVGGLFDVAGDLEETALRQAVDRVNADPTLFPSSRISATIEKVPVGDSFHASKKGAIFHS